jgi:hypothetical protein
MRIKILAVAEQELSEAMDYYNQQCAGLGYEMLLEVKESINRIKSFPEAWPKISDSTRRCLVHRFPYGILYKPKKNEIIVYAIMHLQRDPEKWTNRLSSQV